jgi:hypothetical protein
MADDNDSVKAIFHAALKFNSADERNDFLDRSCANNAELRSQVDKLLRLHEVTSNASAPPAAILRGPFKTGFERPVS